MNYLIIFFSVNLGWDTEGTGTRSGGSCSQSNVQCECKPLRSCPWVGKMIQSVARKPNNNPTKQKVIKFIRQRGCGKTSGTVDKVYCCDGSKGTFPIECKLRKLKNPKRKPQPKPPAGGVLPAGLRKVRFKAIKGT